MSRLSYSARLFYIGLWCVADDAGWLEWDLEELGALLFPYESPARRSKHLVAWAGELVTMDKVVLQECGECAVIPSLDVHQKHAGGNRSFQYRQAHERHGMSIVRPDLRHEVFDRDDWTCRYCGGQPDYSKLVAEHVINRGPTTMENLVTACRSCNAKKSNRTLEEAGMTLLPVPEVRTREAPEYEPVRTEVAGRVGNGRVGERNGRVGNGSAGARDQDLGETEFQRKVPRPVIGGVA